MCITGCIRSGVSALLSPMVEWLENNFVVKAAGDPYISSDYAHINIEDYDKTCFNHALTLTESSKRGWGLVRKRIASDGTWYGSDLADRLQGSERDSADDCTRD
jgi:hypothetical protein